MKKNLGQINQELRSFAISHGLCSKWQKEWENDWSFDTLAQRYLMGIDFCFKHEYPSNEYLLSNFEQSFRRSVGIIVDDNYSLINPEVCAIIGNSKAKVRTNSNTASAIWVKDNAEVAAAVEGARVDVNGSKIVTDASGKAVFNLRAGSYPFKVTKKGYKTVTGTITVASAAVTQNVALIAE